MTNLPDIMLGRTVQRLRAIADALDRGETLTDLAHQYGIPIRILRRLAVLRPRTSAGRRRAIGDILLVKAIARAREGATYREIAKELRVNLHTLRKALDRKGVTPKTVRAGLMEQAIALYRSGMKVTAISAATGIPLPTLYAHLREEKYGQLLRPPSTTVNTGHGEPDGLREAATLYSQGMKVAEIEARTGLKRATIYSYMHRIGEFSSRRRMRG